MQVACKQGTALDIFFYIVQTFPNQLPVTTCYCKWHIGARYLTLALRYYACCTHAYNMPLAYTKKWMCSLHATPLITYIHVEYMS